MEAKEGHSIGRRLRSSSDVTPIHWSLEMMAEQCQLRSEPLRRHCWYTAAGHTGFHVLAEPRFAKSQRGKQGNRAKIIVLKERTHPNMRYQPAFALLRASCRMTLKCWRLLEIIQGIDGFSGSALWPSPQFARSLATRSGRCNHKPQGLPN